MSSPAMQSKGGQGREGTPGKQADDCPVPKAAGCLPVQRAPRMTQKKQSLLSLTGTRMCMMGSSYFFPLVLDCHCAEDLRGDVGYSDSQDLDSVLGSKGREQVPLEAAVWNRKITQCLRVDLVCV